MPSSKGEGTALRDLLRDGTVTRKLAEIAFFGALCGRTRGAETIFRSLRLLCPGNPHVELGIAVLCAIDGRPDEGLSKLERIPRSSPTQQPVLPPGPIPQDPIPQGLHSLCAGMMLHEAGYQSAAQKKFAESLAQGGEIADLARELTGIKRHG
jgi:hypothetical protein